MRWSNIWVVGVSVLGLLVVVFALYSIFSDVGEGDERCIDVNRVAGFVYDICYDSFSKNIFMLVDGGEKQYDFDSFDVAFVDSQFRQYELIYEDVNLSQLYKFGADRNPEFVNLSINVVGDLEFPVCEEPRIVSVKDCTTRLPGWGEGSLNGTVIEDYVPIEGPTRYNISGLIELADKIDFFNRLCKPEWKCGSWEECVNGFQRRDCSDVNNCPASYGEVKTIRSCEDTCVESWTCEWTECINGFMSPICFDENNCGTSYDFPPKVKCSFDEECIPRIRCEDWTSCNFDYELFDLLEKDVSDVKGVRTRVCRDLNSCVEPVLETKNCSAKVEIYTSTFVECGKEFVGVYDALDDNLIARISRGSEDDSYLDVYFDSGIGGEFGYNYCI